MIYIIFNGLQELFLLSALKREPNDRHIADDIFKG